MNIIELATHHPEINITAKAGELREMAEFILQSYSEKFEKRIAEEKSEEFYTIPETATKLNVNRSTLWRYEKRGVLTPINVGGLRRYRKTDLQKFMKEGK